MLYFGHMFGNVMFEKDVMSCYSMYSFRVEKADRIIMGGNVMAWTRM